MGTVLALLSSLLWGTSDFVGGTLARRLRSVDVVLVSQASSLAGIVVVAAVTGGFREWGSYLGWGAAAGGLGVLALAAFYRALAEGTMGVVAPVAATGVVIPVLAGVALGDSLNLLQALGVVAAIAGVVSVGRSASDGGARGGRRPLLLALVSAVGFGLVVWFLAIGGRTSVVMTLVVMRSASVAVLGGALLALRRRPAVAAADLPALVLVGAFDLSANATYSIAARGSSLAVVAVLASLYPAVTVLFARQVHGERLQRVQRLGVALALAGVALIGAGGGAA